MLPHPSLSPGPYPVLTRLASVPNELILDIAHHLTTTRDIYALLCVNKHLAIPLTHVLSEMLLQIYNGPTAHTLFSDSMQHAESLISRLVSLNIDLNASECHCPNPSLMYCRCDLPLHHAITENNRLMVATLLRHGASITAHDASGNTAVHHAIYMADRNSRRHHRNDQSDFVILRMLLGDGRLNTMNAPEALNRHGMSWLNIAVRKCWPGSVALVMPFLAPGLDVNVADNELCTPLQIAIHDRRPDLIKLLLAHGANYRTVDSKGSTPFATACGPENCEMVEAFVNHDPGLTRAIINKRGETAEMYFQRLLDAARLTAREETADRGWETVYLWSDIGKWRSMVEKLRQLAGASSRVDDADVKEAGACE